MSPRSLADSQRPFVWIRSRISPLESAFPQGFRESSIGMWPYGDCPLEIRSAPITPEYPTSITLRGASTLIPIRKPSRKTVAAASSQTGQMGRNALPVDFREPIQMSRPTR